MGHISTKIKLIGSKGKTDVKALVDTGSSLTVIPESIANKIGIKVIKTEKVETGSGLIDMKVGSVGILIEGEFVQTRCWISDFINKTLLGVIVLEEIGFIVNPNKRKIERGRQLLY